MAGAESGPRSKAVPPIILVEDGHQAVAPKCQVPRDLVLLMEDSNARRKLEANRNNMVGAESDLVKSQSKGRTLHHADGRRLPRGQHKDESLPHSSVSYTDHGCAEPLVGRQPKPKTRVQLIGYNGQAQKPECPFFLRHEHDFPCQKREGDRSHPAGP